jgi:hypothetical protein
MVYVNHKEDVVHRYGVELVGWTPEKFCNPSELTTSLPVLRKLLNAIKYGTCKFAGQALPVLGPRITGVPESDR